MTSSTATVPPRESPVRATLALNLALVALLVLVSSVAVVRALGTRSGPDPFPQSTAMEQRTGVRFSRVVVVGDGGLLTVSYVVLDPEKATRFQADRDHPPLLRSEARPAKTQRASIMRAGHAMRAGQTYYLVYENTSGALRSGERVTLTYDGIALKHAPVL